MKDFKLKILNENPLTPVDLEQIKGGLSNPINPNCFINFCKCNDFTCKGGNVHVCPKDSSVCVTDSKPVCPNDLGPTCPGDSIICRNENACDADDT